MPAGLEVYNANGTLQFSLDNRLLRTLVIDINSGTTDGSTTINNPNQGMLLLLRPPADLTGVPPRFSVSGNTVSWTFDGAPTNERQAQTARVYVY